MPLAMNAPRAPDREVRAPDRLGRAVAAGAAQRGCAMSFARRSPLAPG
ncbi:uncharacterized protein SOCEGT47_059790 [Sorangium cellulosum]|uniref:Uncharacterized protein n=1 Tax=Sorangium cellulosum TaxID=56 RepID=A0A4V0NE99_SORCE|nr:hypothetical protein [Sorangium cellulosum]AUX25432.1 uncharacterized protein SOCEGT47_059790 [Sorangium cellulosum]